MDNVLKSLVTWVVDGIKSIIDLLPDSPFRIDWVPDSVQQMLGYVNYFVPVGKMVKTMLAWTICVGVFYAAMIFMRWLKAIE